MTTFIYPHTDLFDLEEELREKNIIPNNYDLIDALFGGNANNDCAQYFSLEAPMDEEFDRYAFKVVNYIKKELKKQGIVARGIYFNICW